MKKSCKFLSTLTAIFLMTLMLATSASALTLAPDVAPPTEDPRPSISEPSGDQTAPVGTESVPNSTDSSGESDISCGGMLDDVDVPAPIEDPVEPDVEPRNWLAEQIRLQPYAYGLSSDGTLYVDLELTDATKIIFIVDQVCPTGYTDDGGYYASGFGIPCGIGRQLYRYLSAVSHAAAMYDFGGVETLMANYSSEELAAVYADLREAAMPYHAELIEWLDGYSVCITMTNPITVPEVTEPITGPAPEWPINKPYEEEPPIEGVIEDWPIW